MHLPMTAVTIACATCGGPLHVPPNAVRVSCTYCQAINDVASEGAVRVAKKLEQFGIRMPDQPMTTAAIDEHFAQLAIEERRKRATLFILLGVFALVAALVAVVGLLWS